MKKFYVVYFGQLLIASSDYTFLFSTFCLVKLPPTFSQIADGGDLEPQMFGLTTKFNNMQKETINKETPAIGNVLLCEVLSVKQKRQLAAEKFDVHNYVYRNICHSEMMMNDFKDGSGYGIFSGSRNYDDVYVKFDKLNERQIALLNEWGLSQHLA